MLKEQISGRSTLISADSGLMRQRPMPVLSTALGSRVWRGLTDKFTVLAVGDVVVPDVDGSTQPPPPDVQPDQDAHKESEHAAHNAQYYQHGVVHPIPQYAYMSNSLVPAGGMPPPQFAVPLGMAQTPGPLPPLSPNSLAKVQGANQWPSVAFSRGPDKKKRQREDFNTSQLKRLVEVYDMEESQRPDREQLAKELDQLDGGRNVDSAAIKAWMKNRFHSLKRTAGARSLVPGERKERQDFNSAQLKRLCEVYDMDPTQRPDREIVAKEIDKLEGGRPVTQYDVLAWMQTRKRMIKKKEERNALNKDPDALRSGVNMHAMPPQPQIAGVQASWQMQQPTFLVHPPHPPPEGQPPPPPDGDLPQVHLPPGVVAHAPASVVMPVGVIGGGIGVGGMPVSKGLKNDRIKRPRMDYNDAQVRRACAVCVCLSCRRHARRLVRLCAVVVRAQALNPRPFTVPLHHDKYQLACEFWNRKWTAI